MLREGVLPKSEGGSPENKCVLPASALTELGLGQHRRPAQSGNTLSLQLCRIKQRRPKPSSSVLFAIPLANAWPQAPTGFPTLHHARRPSDRQRRPGHQSASATTSDPLLVPRQHGLHKLPPDFGPPPLSPTPHVLDLLERLPGADPPAPKDHNARKWQARRRFVLRLCKTQPLAPIRNMQPDSCARLAAQRAQRPASFPENGMEKAFWPDATCLLWHFWSV